jgi:dihydrolipoamide dehydrogenase
MSNHFDIAVIGGGPGGYVAALKAGQLGASTAIIEQSHLGGTCLNNGCIPSKALLASAELLHHIQHAGELGVEVGPAKANWEKIQARKDKVLATLRGGIKGLLTARKVSIFQGSAVLDGPGKIAVKKAGGAAEQITADKVILASGSIPSRIPGWPADANIVCTSDEALHWKTLPQRLLIVGGGVIGCEFACMMQAMGVDVTVVEMLPQILPNMDAQIAELLTKIFTKRGIKVHVGVKIEQMHVTPAGGAKATLGNGQAVEADRVLVATGRRPNTAELNLASVGITPDRGFVRVDDRMQTPVRGYYCIGDANGRCLLAHAASAHGIVAVENALGHDRVFDAPIPNCVYTFPEIASVGMTAEEARAKGLPVSVGNFPLAFLGKAMAVSDTEGFVKVIRNRETNQLLGVHMIGHNATECIAAAGALLHQKVTVEAVAETVFAHPTISESIKEAAEDALSMALHLPPRKVMRVVAGVA